MPVFFGSYNKNVFKNSIFYIGLIVGVLFTTLLTILIIIIIDIAITVKAIQTSSASEHWSYESQDKWGGLCRTGKFQSPISLEDSNAEIISLANLEFGNFDVYYNSLYIENNGHTVQITYLGNETDLKPFLRDGVLSNSSILNNIHFHWPSEHTINGEQYNLEAHFVFFSSKYQSLEDALLVPNAVTVIAAFYEIVQTVDENNIKTHYDFQIINRVLKKIHDRPGSGIRIDKGLIIEDFLPENIGNFFQYTGSLTTPNCNEDINWYIFREVGEITENDFKNLTKILTEDDQILEYNNRDLQDLNGRTVYYNNVHTVR